MEHQSFPSPHVLIFPLPVQGHVTPMLHLAELLCLADIQVTFLNTSQNHQLLTQNTNIEARFARYPSFRFKTIPQGLPNNDSTQTQDVESNVKDLLTLLKAMIEQLKSSAVPLLRDLLFGSTETDKITCFILDGWLSFAYDIANESDVPAIAFRCSSACANWVYLCIPQLIDAGEVPFKENKEMDQLVTNVAGMESFLRCRDLPSFCRSQVTSSSELKQFFTDALQRTKHAHSLILNTFEDLEGPILSLFRSQCTRVYPIGPLHAHLTYRLGKEETPLSNNSSSSLREVDKSCISWLDQKPDKSVVYVSFGSTTKLTRDQIMELWAGLIQSKKYFLWVVTSNIITGSGLDSPTRDDLLEGTKKRGYIVKWAPQDEVLVHRAIGGFMTHSGWNSTQESIIAGVPMLCWPYFADQQVNSRFVSDVWKIGLDMKDTCDRKTVEKMINDLMDARKNELEQSMDNISQLAKKSIAEGGSSYSNLNNLIDDIKAMSNKGELWISSLHQ